MATLRVRCVAWPSVCHALTAQVMCGWYSCPACTNARARATTSASRGKHARARATTSASREKHAHAHATTSASRVKFARASLATSAYCERGLSPRATWSAEEARHQPRARKWYSSARHACACVGANLLSLRSRWCHNCVPARPVHARASWPHSLEFSFD